MPTPKIFKPHRVVARQENGLLRSQPQRQIENPQTHLIDRPLGRRKDTMKGRMMSRRSRAAHDSQHRPPWREDPSDDEFSEGRKVIEVGSVITKANTCDKP